MRNMLGIVLFSVGVGLICTVIGAILTEQDKRRRDRDMIDDIEERLRAGGTHWLYCSPCERWWFVQIPMCRRCGGKLEEPAKEVLVEFMIEMREFWEKLAYATKRRPYFVRRIFRENEVAGLLWTMKRHQGQPIVDRKQHD